MTYIPVCVADVLIANNWEIDQSKCIRDVSPCLISEPRAGWCAARLLRSKRSVCCYWMSWSREPTGCMDASENTGRAYKPRVRVSCQEQQTSTRRSRRHMACVHGEAIDFAQSVGIDETIIMKAEAKLQEHKAEHRVTVGRLIRSGTKKRLERCAGTVCHRGMRMDLYFVHVFFLRTACVLQTVLYSLW